MNSISFDATEDTPQVICNIDGTVSIIGKSLPEDSFAFYNPIHDWISKVNAENLEITLRLDYMNTSSTKQIYTLLELANNNQSKKSIKIKWYYNENDDEALDLGKEFESLLKQPFEFYGFLES